MSNVELHYTISMTKPSSHYFEVAINVKSFASKVDPTKLRFVMPVWTPGSYLVREFSRNILDFSAADADAGIELASYKDSKNSWIVETGSSNNIVARYRVYAFEYTVDTSYLDNLHAIINGASVFMYVEELQNEKIALTIEKDPEWKEISTGLEPVTEQKENKDFVAPNFDILVDTPIEIGNQKVHSFLVEGVEHQVSIYSQRAFDQTAFVNDIKRIVETTVKIIGQIPYKKYVFLIDFTDEKYGGLEHLNSTHCIASLFKLEPQHEYRQMLSLYSHEFFHAWNVKRMRPKGLGPFNYSTETYTKSLWIAEGITSYYDDLILRRAGIYTVGEYLDALSINVNQMLSLGGSKWQSAEESSFDTWIKQYRPNENSPNALCSYYTQGAVIGWLIDLEIRKKTHSAKNLDNVMRLVFDRTYLKENRGYTDEEFESACNEVAEGTIATEIYETRVRGKKPLDFQRYLDYVGLQLAPKSKAQTEQGFLGIKVRSDSGKVVVANVLATSPAEQGGISPGDELIGVDGLRIDTLRLNLYITNRKSGTGVRLTIARDGAMHDTHAELTTKPTFEYRMVKKESASQEERDLFGSWMSAKWEDEIRYDDTPSTMPRRQLFDFI